MTHGTFAGNDPLGIATELARVAPRASQSVARFGKAVVDLLARENGNWTERYAGRMEAGLAAGAGRTIPVRRFHWSSGNNHASRADGAVRLVAELDEFVRNLSPAETSSASTAKPARILLWGHSHGGNVFALATHLLSGDREAVEQFFESARPFYMRGAGDGAKIDLPVWRRVEELCRSDERPLGAAALDFVTFGTPIRYGWDTGGYDRLLHVVHHRPSDDRDEWQARFPPKLWRTALSPDADFVHQIGIAGSNFMPWPLALRTLRTDWRLRGLLENGLDPPGLCTRLGAAMRVAEEGATLLVEYEEPLVLPWLQLLGHAVYTRSRWLPLHCRLTAEEFYG